MEAAAQPPRSNVIRYAAGMTLATILILAFWPGPSWREDANVNLRGARLLVVEDEPLAREMIIVALTQYGADVHGFGSVAEGLKAVPALKPSVIVTDVAMAGEDGFALLHQLRARGDQTPVIAVSALTRADDRTRIMLAGFDDYLQKPVQPAKLANAVARRLHQS